MTDSQPTRYRDLLRHAAQWLFPPRCPVCREAVATDSGLCPACTARLPWQGPACRSCALPFPSADVDLCCGACRRRPPPLERIHAAFAYGFPVDRLLPRFKFHRDLACGRLLADWMAAACADAPRPEALVPVPLHANRLRTRGYDQALELAKPLARRLDVPLRTDLLRRLRDTRAQSALDRAHRRGNLRGAFVAVASAHMPGHVALVDDVMTTGATLHAAAHALRRAGVGRVDAWLCARVP